ncbi:MAG: SH3 domain-containing protein [Candidatus Cloacimonetes bacterium]|nr:SH3 domain-containing protein [Candidatus Cloacimonadota bacterium]
MKKILLTLTLLIVSQILYSSSLYVIGELLNFRQSPNGEKIGSLLKNTKLEVIEEEGDWVKVRVEGWVWKPLTNYETKKDSKKIVHEDNKEYRIVMWNSYLHSNAGSNSSKICSVKKGEKLEIIKEKKLSFNGITVPWYYVKRSNGTMGWVSDADLELP